MGRVLVLYQSKEGNTRAMARHVQAGAEGVDGTETRLLAVEEASRQDLLWCQGLALGAPTNMGTVPWRMKRFWDEEAAEVWQEIDGKFGCAFSSQGGWGGGAELTCMTLMTIMMNYGMLVFGVTDYAGKQFTLHYGATQAGEPREEREKAACRILGKRLAEWVAVYCDGREDLHPARPGYERLP